MPDLVQWVPHSVGSWFVIALVAAAILYLVLRILRRAIGASLRLAVITGTLIVIAVALLVLNSMLRTRGLSLP